MLVFFPSGDPLPITAREKLCLIYQSFAGGGPRAQLRSGAGVRCVQWRCKGSAGSRHHGRPSGQQLGEEPTGRVEVARTPIPATSPLPPCPPTSQFPTPVASLLIHQQQWARCREPPNVGRGSCWLLCPRGLGHEVPSVCSKAQQPQEERPFQPKLTSFTVPRERGLPGCKRSPDGPTATALEVSIPAMPCPRAETGPREGALCEVARTVRGAGTRSPAVGSKPLLVPLSGEPQKALKDRNEDGVSGGARLCCHLPPRARLPGSPSVSEPLSNQVRSTPRVPSTDSQRKSAWWGPSRPPGRLGARHRPVPGSPSPDVCGNLNSPVSGCNL